MSEGDEIKKIITHLQEARDTRILGFITVTSGS